MGPICAGCGSAVAAGALFCARCGRPAPTRQSAPSVPPLPLIGTVGADPRRAPDALQFLDRASPPEPGGPELNGPERVHRPRRALVIDLLPAVFLGAVALWGWRSSVTAWGHLPTIFVVILGGLVVLHLLVRAVLRGRRAGLGRRSSIGPMAPVIGSPPVFEPLPVIESPPVLGPAGLPASAAAGPVPPVITVVPGMPPKAGAPAEWQERTQVPSLRALQHPAGPPDEPALGWAVVLDDGRTLPLDRPAVFGRDPAALPGEHGMALRSIADQTRTVSKTHVKLEPGADSVLVTDRHSTNGVVVITAGVATRCRAGEPMVATQGSVVRFGDREMQVRRQ
jgi:hypothetical protein